MSVNPWLVVMSILGGFCFTLALFIFKHTLWYMETRETSKRPRALYHYVGWYIGLLLFAIGKILEVVPSQYEGLSWSSVSQMSSLALTVVLEALFLPDTDLSRLDYLAYAIVVAGLLCTAPLDSVVKDESFATIFSIAITLFVLFVLAVALRFLMQRKTEFLGLSAESNNRLRKNMPIVLMAEVTLFSAMMMAASRVTVHFITAIFTIVTIYVLAFIAVFLVQLYLLTLALHDYEFGYVVPLFHVMRRYTAIIISLMLGRADEGSPWSHIVLPLFGMILMAVALFLLHHYRENFSHFRSVVKHEERVAEARDSFPAVKRVTNAENTFANAALAAVAQKRAVQSSIDHLLRSGAVAERPDPDRYQEYKEFVQRRNDELAIYTSNFQFHSSDSDSEADRILGASVAASSHNLAHSSGASLAASDDPYTYSYTYAYSDELEQQEEGEDTETVLSAGSMTAAEAASVLRGRVLTQPPPQHHWYEGKPICGRCFDESSSSDDDDAEHAVVSAPTNSKTRRAKAKARLTMLAKPIQGPPPPKVKPNHEDVASASGAGWLALGRGVGWHIPLLPDTDKHSQLERADGLHICAAQWSPTKRCGFCCCFFLALAAVYLIVTLIMSVGLYRGCAGVAPFPALAPLTAFNSTPPSIRFNHIIQRGNHNSFKQIPVANFPGFSSGVEAWDFAHDPLGIQLDRGNRVFELDVHIRGGGVSVFHVSLFDDQSNCGCLVECLRIMLAWSNANPGHTPIVVGMEFKDSCEEDLVMCWNGVSFDDMVMVEDVFRSVWGDRIITPDKIRGSHDNLTSAILTDGWPSLDALRGQMLVFIDDEKELRDLYTSRSPTLANRSFFTIHKDNYDRADLAVFKINDPTDPQGYDLIVQAVERGFIVRTRADSNEEPDNRDNPERLALAISSGAQIISFDWFVYAKWNGVVGPVPAGCNNRTATPDCSIDVINI